MGLVLRWTFDASHVSLIGDILSIQGARVTLKTQLTNFSEGVTADSGSPAGDELLCH